MHFSEITRHLGERGFATRELWAGDTVIFYGMDNVLFRTRRDGTSHLYSLTLADITAEDWHILDYLWRGTYTDTLPFDQNDDTLWRLKHSGGNDIKVDVNPFFPKIDILDARRKSIVAFTRYLFSEG
jgi:hypothetical protein